jgi:hypothetical protein
MPEASSNDNVVQAFNPASGGVDTVQLVNTGATPTPASGGDTAQNDAAQDGAQPRQSSDGGDPNARQQPPQQQRGKHWTTRKIEEQTREIGNLTRLVYNLEGRLQGRGSERVDDDGQAQARNVPQRGQSEYDARQDPGYDPQDPEPDRDSFGTYDQYQRALMRWESRVEMRGRERAGQQHQQLQEQLRETQEIAHRYNNAAVAWERDHPDFVDVVDSLSDIRAEQYPELTKAIFTSHNPAQMMHALALNRPVVDKILRLAPLQQVRALAHIESRLMNQGTQMSKAPPPIAPTGASQITSRSAYRDDFTPEQHLAWKKANGIK